MAEQETVTFAGSTGARLEGVLHRPAEPRGSVLLSHCFTCSKDLHTMTRLADGLAEAGYAVLRFDFTGLGASGGDFSETTLATDVGDLARAATTLIERGLGPCALVGHSLGGAAALLAAARLHTVRAVATVGAPSTPRHLTHLLADSLEEIAAEGCAVVEIGGRPFPVSRTFLDDLEAHDQERRVAELARPLLVVHAVGDETVAHTEGERIFAAARQPKAFVGLPGGDHLLTSQRSAEGTVRILAAWLELVLGGSDGR